MLHGCTLQELSCLMMGLSALRSVGLREVLEHGRCGGDVLTHAREVRDPGVICYYLAVDVPRPGTGPPSIRAAREFALERLELLLKLPLRLGNFLLSGAKLLRGGMLSKLLWWIPRHGPYVGGAGRVILIASGLGLDLRSVGHETLSRGVMAPGVGR